MDTEIKHIEAPHAHKKDEKPKRWRTVIGIVGAWVTLPDGRRIEHFTRTETFGYPFMGWTRIIIDDQDPALFRFETRPWPPR